MKRRLTLDVAGTPTKGKAWRDTVEAAARAAWDEPPMDAGPMRFSVEFWLPAAGPGDVRPLWSTTRPTLVPITDTTLAGLLAAEVIVDAAKLVDVWATKLIAAGPWVGARVLVAELS